MSNRIHFLDGVRGWAALFVLIGHFIDMYGKHNYSGVSFSLVESFVQNFELGRIGVVLFFVISGFVVPFSFNGKDKSSVYPFLIKTFFRLYPAFWFSLIISIFIFDGVGVNIDGLVQVLVNLTMIPKYLGFDSVQGAYWTLHLLLVFYLLCCFLHYFGVLQRKETVLFFITLFGLIAVLFSLSSYFFQIRLPIVMPLGIATMFLGYLFRIFYSDNDVKLGYLVFGSFVYLSLMLFAQGYYYLDGWFKWFSAYFIAIVFFVFMAYFYKGISFLNYLGKISFSMYLLHMLVLSLVFKLLGSYSYQPQGVIVSFVFVLIISYFSSDFSYKYIETKGMSFGRKYIKSFYGS